MSLIWLMVAVFTGGCLLLANAGVLPIETGGWLPVHLTSALGGWMTGIILGTGLWMLPRFICQDGTFRRFDMWWQPVLVHGGVAVWVIFWIFGSHLWFGPVIWMIGVWSTLPAIWIRSGGLRPG
ncbi:MAG: hypothetical protein WEA36_03770 [Balneolaceae bacterium]